MKRTFLKFGPGFLPKTTNRRTGRKNFASSAYRSDGSPAEGEEEPLFDELPPLKADASEEEKVAHNLRSKLIEGLNKKGFVTNKRMISAVETAVAGMKVDEIRTATEKHENQIKRLAGELEKQKVSSANAQARSMFKESLKNALDQAEQIRSAGPTNRGEVTLNVRAAALMTTDNTITGDSALPDDLIESFSIAEFVPKRRAAQYIYDIASRTVVAKVEENRTWLEEGTEEGAFALVAEGGLKPLVSFTLVRNYSTVKKIVGKYVVTEEFAKFRQVAFQKISELVNDKLVRDYSAILTTALNAQAAGYTGTTLDDTVVAPNDYDAIGAVAAQIESLNFDPNVLIIHPQDKWRIRLSKNADGSYLFPTVTENGSTIMLGIRVISTTYQTAGTFTLGEAGLFKIEEEPITVRMGYGIEYTITGGNVTAVSSDFDTNRFRMVVETFFHAYIATNHIGSFVRASFATVKAALLKP